MDQGIRSLLRHYGGSEPREAARAAGRDLLKASGTRDIPVPLERLEEVVGISSVRLVALPVSGQLVSTPDGLVSEINACDSATRQRFTRAHEIAHAFLLRLDALVPSASAPRCVTIAIGSRDEERVCDTIAAEILMPEEAVRHAKGRRRACLGMITALAAQYQTSMMATAIRAADLKLWRFHYAEWLPTDENGDSFRVAFETGTLLLRMKTAMPIISSDLFRIAYKAGGECRGDLKISCAMRLRRYRCEVARSQVGTGRDGLRSVLTTR